MPQEQQLVQTQSSAQSSTQSNNGSSGSSGTTSGSTTTTSLVGAIASFFRKFEHLFSYIEQHPQAISQLADAVGAAAAQGVNPAAVPLNLLSFLAPHARQWAANKRATLAADMQTAEDRLRAQTGIERDVKALLAGIEDLARRRVALTAGDIEVVAKTLCLFLRATSLTVAASVKSLDAGKGKVAGWAAGATVSGLALVACLTAPVIPVAATGAVIIGPAFWGVMGGSAASFTATGGAIYAAVKSSKEVTKVENVKISLNTLATHCRALVGFLAYLYNIRISNPQLNNRTFTNRLRELDKRLLSMDESDWSDPAFIFFYIRNVAEDLDLDIKDVTENLAAMGVSIDPLDAMATPDPEP